MKLRTKCSSSLPLPRFSTAISLRIQHEPLHWLEYSNSGEETITDCERYMAYGQLRPPCFDSNTLPSSAKAMDVYRDSDPGQVFSMQPAHGLLAPCMFLLLWKQHVFFSHLAMINYLINAHHRKFQFRFQSNFQAQRCSSWSNSLCMQPAEYGSIANFASDVKTLNSKITTHMQNGLVEEAQILFEKMAIRNTVTWNSMIRGYFKNGLFHDALHLYNKMPDRDLFTYNTVLAGLMGRGHLDGAINFFNSMPYKDVVSWNSMISGYVQNGLMDKAIWMFNFMPLKNVVSWNLIIRGLLKCEEFDLAENLFNKMGERDIVSWTIMMSAFVKVGRVVEAREFFDAMPVRDVQAWNTMIAGYIDSGYLDTGYGLFLKMPNRNLNSWKVMITGLVNGLRFNDAIRLFSEMPEKCQKIWNSILMGLTNDGFVEEAHTFVEKSFFDDLVSRTILIVGYFGISEGQSAVRVFELMHTRDTTAWNATIFGLITNGHFEDGLRLFLRMKEFGFPMDESSITSALTMCSNLQFLNLGRQAHGEVIKMGFDHRSAVCNALVTMYARCGNLYFAVLQFWSMPHHYDVISWNAIISGFAHHGQGEKALQMFNQMRLTDVRPNHITFTALLSACSHGGLVQKGKYYFDLMRYKYFLKPTTEHYTCIVDLLGRYGLIDEALKFLEQMIEDEIDIPASVWGALLGACRMHKNIDVGEVAGERVLELEPQNTGFYMILAEMYLKNGRKKDAERTLSRMKANVMKKEPGCSWIEVNNTEHVFLSGNRSHLEFPSICRTLKLVLKDEDIEFVTQSGV